jgi:predicted metal-dependent phosphotriesterase family hydrolase
MAPIVRTVRGDVDPADLGITLCHEHVIVDAREGFADPDIYLDDPAEVAEDLREAASLGLRTVVDVTNIGMHRRPLATRQVAELSGLHVVAGAGFYHGHFLPDYVNEMGVDELTESIVREVEVGIEDSGVRAGVIGEVGGSDGGLTPTERRLFLATGQAQAISGAPVVTHTAVGLQAMDQLDLLEEGGADPTKVLVGHMDCNLDLTAHLAVAERGAFVGLDRINARKYPWDDKRVELVLGLIEHGYAGRVILSHDLSRKSRLLKNGGTGYGFILREFVPALRRAGVDDSLLHLILVENPRHLLAFTPRQ